MQRPAGVPALDLARVKGCSGSSAPRPLVAAEVQQDGPDDAALCFEASCNRAVRPGAPLVDNRCYVYRAIGPQVNTITHAQLHCCTELGVAGGMLAHTPLDQAEPPAL